eukprot:364425-Chlamydomonas_euryale.AAC.14
MRWRARARVHAAAGMRVGVCACVHESVSKVLHGLELPGIRAACYEPPWLNPDMRKICHASSWAPGPHLPACLGTQPLADTYADAFIRGGTLMHPSQCPPRPHLPLSLRGGTLMHPSQCPPRPHLPRSLRG